MITWPSGQERTAVERSYVAKATQPRRRILLCMILFHSWLSVEFSAVL
jgi:hypothetical protein